MSRVQNLLNIAKELPQDPGVYRYFDAEGTIIYVGKAKNLRKRVTSYFQTSTQHNNKTKRLIQKIASIKYAIVDTEYDALLLENNLIKKHQPRYNILLKDDKTYPYISISKERFPRIGITRNVNPKEAHYYGPYSHGAARKNLFELLEKTFHFRTCNYNLSEENIRAKKYKVCMEYHIGKCKAPCVGFQTEEDYMTEVKGAKDILKGKYSDAKEILKQHMMTLADRLEYEKAEKTKYKLISLENFESKSIVANPSFGNMEVVVHLLDETHLFISYMRITRGVITALSNHLIKQTTPEEHHTVLEQFIFNNRLKHRISSKEILTNQEFTYEEGDIHISIPKIGDKKKLVDLCLKNLFQYKLEKSAQSSGKETVHRVLETLKSDLRMTELPKHIECFDNSNISGTNAVASMVCFKMGKPSKKDYRHYNIKTVVGPDDFGSMREIVGRRYKRLVEENQPLPQLIIIDGGKGQLSSAMTILKDLGIYHQVCVIGIAKRLEEIYFPEDKDPVMINKKSESLKLIQKLRNEAHRFAITFHRDQRSKNFIKSELEEIEGVGPKTLEVLLKKYKSVNNIREATTQELIDLVGESKAAKIKKGLNI